MKNRKLQHGILFLLIGIPLVAFNNCSSEVTGEVSLSSESCSMASSSLRNPTTINQTVQLINALPKPLTLPCFVQNLRRPLQVVSMQSTFSAQPSAKAHTPRVFIISENFILSVVPTGVGKDLLEMSEVLNSSSSVKGEVSFPVISQLPASSPFDHIISGGGTSCRFCHIGETPVTGYAGSAFSSNILRPNSFTTIPASTLKTVSNGCNYILDQYRCDLMKSIFITGRAQDTAFP